MDGEGIVGGWMIGCGCKMMMMMLWALLLLRLCLLWMNPRMSWWTMYNAAVVAADGAADYYVDNTIDEPHMHVFHSIQVSPGRLMTKYYESSTPLCAECNHSLSKFSSEKISSSVAILRIRGMNIASLIHDFVDEIMIDDDDDDDLLVQSF